MTSCFDLFDLLRWIDGTPLRDHVEPYLRRSFKAALDTFDEDGRPRYNLIVTGAAKKNWKTAGLVLASLWALLKTSPGGNQCYLLANDEDQAADDLTLAKKLIDANPALRKLLVVREKAIARRDGQGFLQILPARDVAGTHGKTYRFAGFDEIHEYRTWDLLEAMQLDPTRIDAQMWITSYASIYHRPGVPLFDLIAQGRAGTDPRMFFSWYAADFTTDADFAEADPETRANPSRGTWADPGYLDQQRRRLPAHKYRRLHLNLPGLPEGSAFQPEPVMDAVARGVVSRPPEPGLVYRAFVDMSGGSADDAVLAVAHRDAEGRVVLDRVLNQGPPPPFDPRRAVERFAAVLREYGLAAVRGDRYAGETFRADFERHGIRYEVETRTKHQLYEAFEPVLNGRGVVLLDVPEVEQQLLGLGWRGGKIDHPSGEHDDWANAAVGALLRVTSRRVCTVPGCDDPECSGCHLLNLESGVWDTGVRAGATAGRPAPEPDPWERAVEPTWAPPDADPELSVVVGIAFADERDVAAVAMTRDEGDDLVVLLRHQRGSLAEVEASVRTWAQDFRVEGVSATGAAEPFPPGVHRLAATLKAAGLAVEVLGDGPAARAWAALRDRLAAGRVVLYASPGLRERTTRRAVALAVAACGAVLVEGASR